MSAVVTFEATSLSTEPQSSQTMLSDLWTQAVEEYRNTANLSKQEEQLLRHPYSAEKFLQLTKDRWDQTVLKRQSRHYETIRFTVCQVLGIFDVISPALGLAGHVASQPWCFPNSSHGCLRHSHPLASFLALSKYCYRSIHLWNSTLNGRLQRICGTLMTWLGNSFLRFKPSFLEQIWPSKHAIYLLHSKVSSFKFSSSF